MTRSSPASRNFSIATRLADIEQRADEVSIGYRDVVAIAETAAGKIKGKAGSRLKRTCKACISIKSSRRRTHGLPS